MIIIIVTVAGSISVVECGGWNQLHGSVAMINYGFDMVNHQVGYFACMDNANGPHFRKTTDGCATIDEIQYPPMMLMLIGTAAFDENTTIGTGFGSSMPGIELASCVFTVDGGESYRRCLGDEQWLISVWNSISKAQDESVVVAVGEFVTFPDSHYGIAMTDRNGVSTYVDSWVYDFENLIPPRYGSFWNASYGFVSGGTWDASSSSLSSQMYQLSERLSITIDGNATLPNLSRRHQVNAYAAVIARTVNGQTFETVFTSNQFYMNQISMASPTVIVAVGEECVNRCTCVIIRSEDGGNTWRQVHASENSLVAIEMINEQEGWAGGVTEPSLDQPLNAFLLHTTDGGRSWTQYTHGDPLAYTVFGFSVDDDKKIYANLVSVSGQNAIFRYEIE